MKPPSRGGGMGGGIGVIPPSSGGGMGGGIGGMIPLSWGGGIGGGIGGMIPLSCGGGIGGMIPLSCGGGIGGGIGVMRSGGAWRSSATTTSGESVAVESAAVESVAEASTEIVVELHATEPKALSAMASAARRTIAGVDGGGVRAGCGSRRWFTRSAERQSPRGVKRAHGGRPYGRALVGGSRVGEDAPEGVRELMGTGLSRRGFLDGLASVLLAAVGARALAGCSSSDVSVRIRRVDGTVQGGTAVVRASVVVTNHTNEARTLPMRLTLTSSSGEVLGTIEETVNIAPAELLCHCINVTVPSGGGSMGGSTLNIVFGEETASASIQALGSAALPDCSYTCNY